jgi:hypothetical protein
VCLPSLQVNVTAPNDQQLRRIFGTILNAKLSDFDDEVGRAVDGQALMPVAVSKSLGHCNLTSNSAACAIRSAIICYVRLNVLYIIRILACWTDQVATYAPCLLCSQVKPLADPITSATIAIYRAVSRELLPTPSKSHYLFNTRDLAKIIQGMMQVGA